MSRLARLAEARARAEIWCLKNEPPINCFCDLPQDYIEMVMLGARSPEHQAMQAWLLPKLLELHGQPTL